MPILKKNEIKNNGKFYYSLPKNYKEDLRLSLILDFLFLKL